MIQWTVDKPICWGTFCSHTDADFVPCSLLLYLLWKVILPIAFSEIVFLLFNIILTNVSLKRDTCSPLSLFVNPYSCCPNQSSAVWRRSKQSVAHTWLLLGWVGHLVKRTIRYRSWWLKSWSCTSHVTFINEPLTITIKLIEWSVLSGQRETAGPDWDCSGICYCHDWEVGWHQQAFLQ